MAILNGTDLQVEDGSNNTLVAFAQNCSINVEHALREITNKQSAGWQENLEGLRSFSIDTDGAYAFSDAGGTPLTNGADDLLNSYILTRVPFTVRFGITGGAVGSGDIYYEGSVFLTSFSASGGVEDTATYSLSFTGTGALTQTVA